MQEVFLELFVQNNLLHYEVYFFVPLKLIFVELPKIDPLIKLKPIIKLTGNLTVSLNKRLTLLELELFCIPIIRNKNKQELKTIAKNNLLMKNDILKNFSLHFRL